MNADDNRFTHVGLCVSDLDRSVTYYCDVLGFTEVARRLNVTDDGSARLLGLSSLDVELVYLQRDGIRIELLWYRVPGHDGDGSPRQMNLLGPTHLAFRVGDFDELCQKIEAAGGSVLPQTMTTFGYGNRGVMTLDPDGIRVELIERPQS
ncbi:MAG TPA: VOC family protein [Acidimicrobiia bacterium]|jgi:catechol 2,3-dioxygenase-like lactoylglutathione lyase family enzyme